jgi:hypothetical protein
MLLFSYERTDKGGNSRSKRLQSNHMHVAAQDPLGA